MPVIEAFALNVIGLVHQSAGNFSEALEYGLKALEIYRSSGDQVAEGALLNAIATIHHELGDTDRALVTYEAALAIESRRTTPTSATPGGSPTTC